MDWFLLILMLLAIIAVSNVINHFVPIIPIPVIQIILGIFFVLVVPGMNIRLEPALFFVLFVAPILFNDGKMIPKSELWKLRVPILLLALGLVFVTVVAGGYLILLLIPGIPLSAAFALAAILSPTDAVAVVAILKKARINKNIMTLLEGEALMNDASGLVAFKLAVAATVTGVFSIGGAAMNFLALALGGLGIGILAALIIIKFRIFLRKLGMEDVTLHMLIQILTPFIIFLTAEYSGVSSVLAVVAGGLVHSIEKKQVESSTLELQIMSENTWSVIMFILNGLVFVLLGFQIPGVMRVVIYDQEISNLVALSYILIIALALVAIRYIWIYLCWKPACLLGKSSKNNIPGPKSFMLISISGVRGAVTLAAAFSIPYTLQNGTPFPKRDLIIFLAAGVILASLIIASIFLPLLSRRDISVGSGRKMTPEQSAGIKLMRAVIRAMKEEAYGENKAEALTIIADCHRNIRKLAHREEIPGNTVGKTEEIKIWLTAIKAEKDELEKLFIEGGLSAELYYKLLEIINHREMLLTQKYKYRVLIYLYLFKRLKTRISFRKKKCDLYTGSHMGMAAQIRSRMLKSAIAAVRLQMYETNSEMSLHVLSHYNAALEKVERSRRESVDNYIAEKRGTELKYRAIQIERNEVQHLYEKGEISRDTANKLRSFINYREADMLQEDEMDR